MGFDSSTGTEQPPDVLRLAALFDRDFYLDWLEELTGMRASSILTVLETGIQQQLLLRKGPAVYLFKGAKEREELISQIPEADKERYHRGIAEILIRELPEDDEKALQVADHLIHLWNDWKGCQWLVRAGHIHVSSSHREEALACFEKVINDLWQQRGEHEDGLFIKAVIGHASNLSARIDAAKSISWLREAKGRAQKLNEPMYALLLEMYMAKYEWLRFDFDKGLRRFRKAFAKVEDLGGEDLLRQTSQFTTTFLFWEGRFKDVIAMHERSVRDVEQHPIGHSSLIAAMMVGYCYAAVSRQTQGLGMLAAIREHCLNKGDRYFAAYASSVIAMVLLSIGRLEDAFHYLNFAAKETRENRSSSAGLVVSVLLAVAHHRRGEEAQALEHLRAFFRNRKGTQTANTLLPPSLAELCWAIEKGELPAVPGASLEDELERMLRDKSAFVKGVAFRYQALRWQAKGLSSHKIARSLLLSTRWLKLSGSETELAKTQMELARHYLAIGDERNGKKVMRAASGALSQTNADLIPDDLRPLMADHRPEKTILREVLALGSEMVLGRQSRKLLQQIVATANRITGGERSALFLLDPQNPASGLQLRASKNLLAEQVHRSAFATSRQIIEEVAQTRNGRIFEVSLNEEEASLPGDAIRSGICVPVLSDGRGVGVLYLDNRLLHNVFKDHDLDLLSYLAAQVSLELDNENAQTEIQRLTQKQKDMELSDDVDWIPEPQTEGILGTSPGIRRVMDEIKRVAKTDTAILILGETGVGKNVVATAIHQHSLRARGRFVTVQCNALAEGLIASELFGHEKGSFTGASDRRIGRFELADKGTLFLDEIGELSADIQARLLRVLQSKEFERVGGGKEILSSDFRLIAATNRDLQAGVRAGKFREDLFYRINVFPIYVPPLRDRKEDIPLLAHHFLGVHAAKQGKKFGKIPQEALDQMMSYDWPGNIRELENVIQRGVISSRSPYFQLSQLAGAQIDCAKPNQFNSLEDNEREHILKALQRSAWKIHGAGGAAELLEMNASTLTSRMKKLGVKRPQKVVSPN